MCKVQTPGVVIVLAEGQVASVHVDGKPVDVALVTGIEGGNCRVMDVQPMSRLPLAVITAVARRVDPRKQNPWQARAFLRRDGVRATGALAVV